MSEKLDKTSEAFLQKENETLKAFVKESEEAQAIMAQKLETYESFIDVKDFDTVAEHLEQAVAYTELGTVEEMKEALEKLAAYETLATPEDIEEAIKVIESYKELGTVEEIAESMKTLETYKTYATLEELDKAVEALETYAECEFTPESAKALVAERKANEAKKVLESLTSKFSISESVATSTLELFDGNVEEASKYLEQFVPAVESIDYEKPEGEKSDESIDPVIGEEIDPVTESEKTTRVTMLGKF
jgi:predicted CoA-binding protein